MTYEIIRVWLYKTVQIALHPQSKGSMTLSDGEISATSKPVTHTQVTKGEFRYYKVRGSSITRVNRKEAWAYKQAGHIIKTHNGFPAEMVDMGFKV